MKIKRIAVIFLIGLLIGVGLSPLTNVEPQKAFESPVSITLAEEAPFNETTDPKIRILGVSDQNKQTLRRKELDDLIARQDLELDLLPKPAQDSPGQTGLDKEHGQVHPVHVADEGSSIKGTKTIAVYGDSMVDTMGTGLPYLEKALKAYYPNIHFNLLNYGVGAQSVEAGLSRFSQNLNYKDRSYAPITQSGANIIVIESFAYNPIGESGLDSQWTSLSNMAGQAQAAGAKILLLATIAPTKEKFGQGPGGIDWPRQQAEQHADLIGRYLENVVNLGKSLGIPVADAYHPTLLANGEGNLTYISSHDHIHPSVAGHQLVAQKIAEKIYQLGVIN